MKITTIVLMIAPLDNKVQMDLIISMLDDMVTPKVEANKLIPLMIMDLIDVLCICLIAVVIITQKVSQNKLFMQFFEMLGNFLIINRRTQRRKDE